MKRLFAWLLPVLATLVGIVVGASLNDFLAGQREKTQRLSELQADAYAEFFRGQALLERARNDEGNRAAADAIIRRAKLRIAIWASPSVITAMNKYWRTYHGASQDCKEPEKQMLDARIYETIRAEALGEDNVPIKEGEMVTFIFVCTLPDNKTE